MPYKTPPQEHQFKPGEEWRGNAGGRPKDASITSILYDLLDEIAIDGIELKHGNNVRKKVAKALAVKAMGGNVAAIKLLKDWTEGPTIQPIALVNQPAANQPPAISFRDFVSAANPRFKWYPHCVQIADVLQRVADGQLKRVMIFAPPRSGKSELVSRLFSAYLIYRYPWKWVGLNSYGADLARTLSRAAQENFLKLGGNINPSVTAVSHWETGQGGGMWSAGVGGPITGKGFHYGIIDDVLKNHIEASSHATRESHKEWWASTFTTREEPDGEGSPDGAIVIMATRWHDDDLPGWLLNQERGDDDEELIRENWHIVFQEAIKEDHPPDLPPTCTVEPDPRQPGEPLCPQRRPLSKLRQIEARNAYFFAALYQQTPRPKAGTLFPIEALQWHDAAPHAMQRIRYWDKAGADVGKGDWTVGVLLGKDGEGNWWIENVVRGQWPAAQRNRIILATAERDKLMYGRVKIGVEQPPGLAKESTDSVVRMLAGFDVIADPVHNDKIERAEPAAAQMMAGNFRIVRDPSWTVPFLKVLEAFPFGAHDDDVDALSGGFNLMARKPKAYSSASSPRPPQLVRM